MSLSQLSPVELQQYSSYPSLVALDQAKNTNPSLAYSLAAEADSQMDFGRVKALAVHLNAHKDHFSEQLRSAVSKHRWCIIGGNLAAGAVGGAIGLLSIVSLPLFIITLIAVSILVGCIGAKVEKHNLAKIKHAGELVADFERYGMLIKTFKASMRCYEGRDPNSVMLTSAAVTRSQAFFTPVFEAVAKSLEFRGNLEQWIKFRTEVLSRDVFENMKSLAEKNLKEFDNLISARVRRPVPTVVAMPPPSAIVASAPSSSASLGVPYQGTNTPKSSFGASYDAILGSVQV